MNYNIILSAQLDREYKKHKEKIADLENKLKIEYFKKDLMVKVIEQINKGNEYELVLLSNDKKFDSLVLLTNAFFSIFLQSNNILKNI